MMRIQSFQISIFQYYRFNNEGYIITSRMECTSYNISNMGNQCCSDRTADGELKNACTTNDLLDNENDQPSTSFARLVNQHIDLHPKVKQTYYIYKPHHSSERKGAKLPLYYIYNYCAYYEGQWKNGKPHGYGRMVYDDGSLYEGCFRNGAADCKQALFVRDSSTFYKGSIKNNKANGYGQLATPKMFYKGYWVDDLPQGKARQIYSSASFYEGNFINGEKQGDGIYQWNKNEYYIGKFSKNMFNGQGDLTTKEFYYRGLFKDGKREGKGCYRDNVSKFVYTGNFQNNRPFGNGQIVYEDGSTITGQFDGFEKIKGVLTVKNGPSVTLHVTPENTKILNIDKK